MSPHGHDGCHPRGIGARMRRRDPGRRCIAAERSAARRNPASLRPAAGRMAAAGTHRRSTFRRVNPADRRSHCACGVLEANHGLCVREPSFARRLCGVGPDVQDDSMVGRGRSVLSAVLYRCLRGCAFFREESGFGVDGHVRPQRCLRARPLTRSVRQLSASCALVLRTVNCSQSAAGEIGDDGGIDREHQPTRYARTSHERQHFNGQ